MAQTESTMPALGLAAANFHLPDVVSGATVGLDSFAGKRALLVMFISRHCPYVQHVKHELARLGKDYAGEALGMVALSPNYVVQYPDDAPELLKEMAAEQTMENTTHLFLATRFNCNKCHDHPFEHWNQDQYYQTAAFFAKVNLARDPASGERNLGGTAVEGAKPLYEIIR